MFLYISSKYNFIPGKPGNKIPLSPSLYLLPPPHQCPIHPSTPSPIRHQNTTNVKMAGVTGRVVAFWVVCMCFCVSCGQQGTPRHSTSQSRHDSGTVLSTSVTSSTTSPFTQQQQQQQPSTQGEKHHKPQATTDVHQRSKADTINQQHHQQQQQQHPEDDDDGTPSDSSERQITDTKVATTTSTITHNNVSKSSSPAEDSEGAGRDSANKRTVAAPQTKAQQLRSPPSLAGTMLLLLISLVIAGSLFVMLLCFLHKWRENMGPG